MTTETRRRLRDALRSCSAISCDTVGLDLAAYERGDMVRDAVGRRLGIIGGATLDGEAKGVRDDWAD